MKICLFVLTQSTNVTATHAHTHRHSHGMRSAKVIVTATTQVNGEAHQNLTSATPKSINRYAP